MAEEKEAEQCSAELNRERPTEWRASEHAISPSASLCDLPASILLPLCVRPCC